MNGLRPSDLFGRPLSAEQLRVPFVDLWIGSLLELIEGDAPALRFSNQPAGKRSVLLLTSDQDGAAEEPLAVMMAYLRRLGARATFLLTSGFERQGEVRFTAPSPGLVEQGRRWGMHFSVHPVLSAGSGRTERERIADHLAAARAHYQVTDPVALRFDRVVWSGWIDPVLWLRDNGIRYDLNYLTCFSKNLPSLGYMTGSGLPLRFYGSDGLAIGVRQLATQLDDHPDDRLQFGPATPEHDGVPGPLWKLPRPAYFQVARQLLEDSAERYHSPLVVNNHPQQFFFDPDWLVQLIRQAQALDVAVWSVADYDAFLRGLRGSRYTWDPALPGYRLAVVHEQQDLVLLNIPAVASVIIDGKAQPARRASRWGREVSIVTVGRGEHTVSLPDAAAGGGSR